MSDIFSNIIGIIISTGAFLISISCHEFAHGFVAYKLGDPTAKMEGRLTLNPLKHFDIFGILFFFVFHFGWAKGVPIDSRYFKDEKKGMFFSALAGPVTNIILAFLSLIIFTLITKMRFTSEIVYQIFYYIAMFLQYMVSVNAMLAIFNLIPIPPLDGSKIFFAILPDKYYFKILSYDRYMMIIALALVWLGALDKLIANGVTNLVSIMEKIIGVFI